MSRFNRRPDADEYYSFYETYVGKVPSGSVLETLRRQGDETQALLGGIPAGLEMHRYAPGKWTVRELVCHVVDTEREFAFRAMRFARGDQHALPSFDQDRIMAGADLSGRSLASLSEEARGLRAANLALFGSFSREVLDRTGIASGYRFTVRALIYIVAGHERHHIDVLKKRYL